MYLREEYTLFFFFIIITIPYYFSLLIFCYKVFVVK